MDYGFCSAGWDSSSERSFPVPSSRGRVSSHPMEGLHLLSCSVQRSQVRSPLCKEVFPCARQLPSLHTCCKETVERVRPSGGKGGQEPFGIEDLI
jgi:hypothetical protein